MRLTRIDTNFYGRAMRIALPIIIQNGITQFVNMLDNIMVGRVGTDPMSGVAIVNELLFVWYLCVFGGLSGIGIFTAQFYGKKDHDGIRYTFRLMLILCVILLAGGFLILMRADTQLISLFLHEDGGAGNVQATLGYAEQYLRVMLIGLLPFAVTQSYATTLRSMGETVVPMNAGIVAVAVNLIGNYILIFGKFGAPALGVVGAAIATALSRYVEMAIIILYTGTRSAKYPFIKGAVSSFRVPIDLTVNCVKKGTPLLLNEALWSGSMAMLTQSYSLRGLSVVAAINISQTLTNVFNVLFIAMGSAIGIIIGQELGMGKTATVQRDAYRLTAFSLLISTITITALLVLSGIFPHIYNTSEEIRATATGFIRIAALCTPIHAYANASYFILRSGGKTFITFLFDSCFAWIVPVPLAYVLSRFTQIPILQLYLCVMLAESLKCVIGFFMVRKGIWINDLTQYGKA